MENINVITAPGPDIFNLIQQECREQLANKIHIIIASLAEAKVPDD